jgi:hypothetical protein
MPHPHTHRPHLPRDWTILGDQTAWSTCIGVRARWTRLQAPDSGRLHRVTDGFKDRPDTTFGTVNADVLAHFGPGFQRIDFVEVIQSNSWPE